MPRRAATLRRITLVLAPALALLVGLALAPASLLLAADVAVAAVDYNENEFPPLPVPAWVRPIDQGVLDSRLTGLQTPLGVRVEIVAQEPVVVDPVALTFADDGTPHVLEWRMGSTADHVTYDVELQDGTVVTVNRMQKDTRDELKILLDTNCDGLYDKAAVLLADLEIPSSLLLHDDWLYLSSLGRVVRRRASLPGGAYDQQQEIVRGLCGFHHHQASGLTLSHDGWLYITSGDDDNRGEGSDGSRATVLRTGAIFRCRPDGSALSEFARGFRNPYRDVSFDHLYNMFHVDNDQEDGSKFQGVRLMHVVEGADYGWRLAQGAVCCRTDFQRGAVFGERPGKLPALLKTGRGSPAGLLIYQGTRFPDFFQGLLIYPDVYRKLVRAYRVERRGSTFAVVEQFELMRSDDPLFRPCQAVMGPDGAIYIVDWRTDSGGAGRLWGDGQHGRIYRLTWSGLEGLPADVAGAARAEPVALAAAASAIPRGPIDAWAAIPTCDDARLLAELDTPDYEIRRRVARELVRRGEAVRAALVSTMLDRARPAAARAAALGAACQLYNSEVREALAELLSDPDFEIRRLAADGLSRHATPEEADDALLGRLAMALCDPHPASRRAVGLALGAIVARLDDDHPARMIAAGWLADAIDQADPDDMLLFDGLLRGLERLGDAGMAPLVEAASSRDERRREAAVRSLEALRTAPAARALDQVLDQATALSDDQVGRLMETYRHILVEPPIDAAGIGRWLLAHPQAAPELKLRGLESLAMLGGTNPDEALPVVLELLDDDDPQMRLGAAGVIGDYHLVRAAGPLASALADSRRGLDERRALVRALSQLRQRDLPFGGRTEAGVERVLDELVSLTEAPAGSDLRGELVELLGAVDYKRARPLAVALLDDADLLLVRRAIGVLGARRDDAIAVAQRFVGGRLDRALLPQVAAALQTHQQGEAADEVALLLTEVFRGGLLVTLDPVEVERVEKLVHTTGDPQAGRAVYLDQQKSQCARCHRLEGVGGEVGPDLSRIWETHSVAKIIESMVDPSREIKEGYQAFIATTLAGQVHNGLKRVDDAQRIVLRDSEGRDVEILRAELDELVAAPKSLMPEGVFAQLEFQQFIDLVAFLKDRAAQESLRGVAARAWVAGPLPPALDAVDLEEAAPDPHVPLASDDRAPIQWQQLECRADATLDVFSAVPHTRSASYLLAYLYSPREQTVQFHVRFDDELRLVVNGRTVHRSTVVHTDEVVDVTLSPGWNTVLARVVNHEGGCSLKMSADGEGLRWALAPQ